MVTVFGINQHFAIKCYANPKKKTSKGLVQFIVKPLRYAQKTKINTQTVSHVKGELTVDHALSTFLTIKYSLVDIKGLKDMHGKAYKLEFEKEDDYEILTDDCVEALINCELGYVLNFYAKDAINSTPHQIVNPATFRPLDGVEFKPWNEAIKKK